MVKVTGRKRHVRRLTTMRRRVAQDAGTAIFAGAGILETEMRRLIVRDSIQGEGHVPSAPGDPPNRDTGALDASIKAIRKTIVKSEVEATAPHAIHLQFGTSRMAARPFADVATKNTRARIIRLVRAAARRAVRRS